MNYVISTRELLCGGLLLAVTMVVHAGGMVITLRASRFLSARVTRSSGMFLSGARVLVPASWMIMITHICEVMLWAAFLVWCGALPSWSTANYYTLLQYTSVGSELSLPYDWRLLGGMLPMAGMLTFAWSTAVLLGLVVAFEEAQKQRGGNRKSHSAIRVMKDD